MKKLLVVLMAAMMVLSVAAVSMAATVEGDWRAEWVMQDGVNDDDLFFSKYDLRFNFKGKVSDNVEAYLQLAYDNSVNGATVVDPDSAVSGDEIKGSSFLGFAVKEYYVTFNQSWGKVQAGFWDYKLVPSRVLLKPHGVNAVNAKDMQFVFDIPVGEALSFGLFMDPDLREDAMDYDIKVAYKADSFGAEVHYYNDPAIEDGTYTAFDLYYKINDNFKAFVYGIQAGEGKQTWVEELAPVIGATATAGAFTASLEYALEEAAVDYTPYALQLKYAFTNKVNLEVEYQNVDEDNNKLIIRPRVKF